MQPVTPNASPDRFEESDVMCGRLFTYVFRKDVGISAEDFVSSGYKGYREKYEPFMKERLAKHRYRPSYFHAEKGDVLTWHANLIHGGSQRRDLNHFRRARVCHYFGKGTVTYHDLANSLARSRSETCLLRKQED